MSCVSSTYKLVGFVISQRYTKVKTHGCRCPSQKNMASREATQNKTYYWLKNSGQPTWDVWTPVIKWDIDHINWWFCGFLPPINRRNVQCANPSKFSSSKPLKKHGRRWNLRMGDPNQKNTDVCPPILGNVFFWWTTWRSEKTLPWNQMWVLSC